MSGVDNEERSENGRPFRGIYRSKGKVPRQILYNRKKKLLAAHTLTACDNHSVSSTNNVEISAESTGIQTYEPLDTDQGSLPTTEIIAPPPAADSVDPADRVPKVPLYEGSMLSTDTSHLLLKSYMCRHHLTGQAQEDLLQLLQLHLPKENKLPSSKYLFQKHNAGEHVDLSTYHYYCSECFTTLPSSDTAVCPNTMCNLEVQPDTSPYFLTVSVSDQLKTLLSRPGLYQSLQQRNQDSNNSCISDICDGSIYRKLSSDNQPLSKETNISLTLNSDGVQVYQSTNKSMWPVLLMINELPFTMRKSPKNIILAGLWFAEEKPPMQFFLKPIIEMLLELESGIQVHPFGSLFPFQMKVYVICACFDLPARATALNMIQFNGKQGCNFCQQEGVSFPTERGGHVHIFPYIEESPTGPPRTHQSYIDDAKEAVKKQSLENGIKGPTWLSCLKHFDTANGVSPEYMHSALLGVAKTILNFWMKEARSRGLFSNLHANMDVVEKRISQIEVPSEIRRKPRALSELKHWKASEFRSWVLFYAVPVLNGTLNHEYLQHYVLFSEGLWLLLQSTVSHKEVDEAEMRFKQFCADFKEYYGDRYCTANVHMLLHFAKSVRNLGPLWVHSAFPFEDINGWLGELFHGARDPQKEIVKAVCERQKMSAEVDEALCGGRQNDDVEEFLCKMVSSGQRYSVTCNLGQGHLVLGKVSNLSTLSPAECMAIQQFSVMQITTASVYHRLLKSGIVYSASSYMRSKITNDSVICFQRRGQKAFGLVQKFVSFCTDGCSSTDCSLPCQHVVIVTPYEVLYDNSRTEATARYIHHVKLSRETKVYFTKEILGKCVYMQFTIPESTYIAEIPNHEEKNL